MNTPIYDFVNRYKSSDLLRLHMPGHKGKGILGFEELDITEIKGADSLFEASGIICESEKNASELFGADTFYSAEGSSLSIRAMLYLACAFARKCGRKPIIAAGRNVHKTFVNTAAMLDFETVWLCGETRGSYLSCNITPCELDSAISGMVEPPCAIYITSPDYLGNMCDIKGIAAVCKKHGCLCLVDNAHGAYLKFLKESAHPIDLGADICCDSAHKTLPVLTGGAYLHISKDAPAFFKNNAKSSMALFGSTSPSYLILQSLDLANAYIYDGYCNKLFSFIEKTALLKSKLIRNGFALVGDEPLKLTIATKSYGYTGDEFAAQLRIRNIECEFCDPDFMVLMLTPEISDNELKTLENVLLNIMKRDSINEECIAFLLPEKKLSIRDAYFSSKKELPVSECLGRIYADVSVGCPPAVPIIVSGEIIDEKAVRYFEYYGIKKIRVIV